LIFFGLSAAASVLNVDGSLYAGFGAVGFFRRIFFLIVCGVTRSAAPIRSAYRRRRSDTPESSEDA
jgi:hypothetical protein